MSLFSFSLPTNYWPLFIVLLFAVALFFIWRKKSSVVTSLTKMTPTLNQYSRDLTQQAAEGRLDPVIGREEEIGGLTWVLFRRNKNNPVLVGKLGVGKTAIVEGLVAIK